MDEFSNGEWSKAKIKHEVDLEYSKWGKWIWLTNNGSDNWMWIISRDFSWVKRINANNSF